MPKHYVFQLWRRRLLGHCPFRPAFCLMMLGLLARAPLRNSTGWSRTSGDSLTAGNSSSFTVNARAVSAAQSTISASPSAVAADNHTTSTITVTLNDAYGNPVSGKTVTLAKSGGSSTISAASGSSSASGVVTFTVLDAVGETTTYTATDSTDSITITQTASVTFTSLPWFNTGWHYRMTIQINSNQVSGPLTNFPALINLNSSPTVPMAAREGRKIA